MQKLKKTDSLVLIVSGLIYDAEPASGSRFENSFQHTQDNQYDEIVEMNRYWRHELSKLPVNTISERECLIDMIEPTDWLRHFKSQVLPTIVRFKLPKAA
jgi:hypothetical protein